MTKKDYNAIVDVLFEASQSVYLDANINDPRQQNDVLMYQAGKKATIAAIAKEFARVAAHDSSRFDQRRFLSAVAAKTNISISG